jgi:hypothetical protein
MHVFFISVMYFVVAADYRLVQQCFSLTPIQHQLPVSQQYFFHNKSALATSQPNEAICSILHRVKHIGSLQ